MKHALIEFLAVFPEQLATLLLAMLPIGESRAAIPVGIEVWGLSAFEALIFALIGNVFVFFPLYFGLEFVRTMLEKYIPFVTRVIDARIEKSKKRVEKKYERYGAFALFLFTAVPLPLTGVWTATLAAIALKIPFRYAFPAICSGAICAALIVLAITLGVGAV